LTEKHFHLGALVLNKVLPSFFLDEGAGTRAAWLCAHTRETAEKVAPAISADPDQVERVLREVAESFRNFAVVAQREAKQRAELGAVPDVVATAQNFDTDIYDLSGLLRLGQEIWS
jgi:hypothetical protein